ncbi:MAG: hypothetical protein AAGK01_14195, partial [Pseudomonadota bacterium]
LAGVRIAGDASGEDCDIGHDDIPSVPQTGDHLRLANIQKKQGMGGLHRRPEGPKGNLFMTGGAGRQRSCQHGRKGTGCGSSADLVQDCSRRKPDGYRVWV